MKAVLHWRPSPGLIERLAGSVPAWLEVVTIDETDREGFSREIAAADALLHVLEPVTAAMIASAPRLRLIQKIGAGVNTIDLAAAEARGIAVTNMPGTNSQAVAEMTLMLILAALRRVVALDKATRAGQGWSLDRALFDSVGELQGRTVGLIGYGEVPRRLVPALVALGSRILYTARAPKRGAVGEFRPLDRLLAESDVISLHLPLTPATGGGWWTKRHWWRRSGRAGFARPASTSSPPSPPIRPIRSSASTMWCWRRMSPGSRPRPSSAASPSPSRIAAGFRLASSCSTESIFVPRSAVDCSAFP